MSENSVDALIQQVVQQKSIDANQVRQFAEMVGRDHVVSEQEVEMLFQVNQALGTNDEHCPEWKPFFVDTVSRLVIRDLFTPGEIDQQEGDWLATVYEQFTVGNEAEAALLHEIRNTTSVIAGKFGEKFQPFE